MEKSIGNIKYTKKIAQELANKLKVGDIVFLYGDLGAGKTTFTKYVLESFGYTGNVQSPTFVLERLYQVGENKFYHLDLYRIKKLDLGLLEFLNEKDKKAVYLIEWPEVVEDVIKPDYKVYLRIVDENLREIKIENV